ncbi:hypothetical protein Ae201684P_004863 [Aphanomyces euteiches]|uniref:NodB homology domain-containing protein n=1 Tax=Aphanomyces euteiches TaxID=100861 RepID=A0A6G0WKH8_9STRA|nr:hypothetical protein Ae201684_014262 [Aphanomyces euteiches]KAH9069173.1 hypothetical protein Ae201684P_004863 [Aphanomyces euteiches]
MFGLFLVWNLIVLFVWSRHSADSSNNVQASDNLPTTKVPSSSNSSAKQNVMYPTSSTTFNATTNATNAMGAPSNMIKYSFPKFVARSAVSPVPTTATCGIPRKAKSPNEIVYLTVDDGPSDVGRINLLSVLEQLNNRTDSSGKRVTPAYISFMESGYNFCGSGSAIVNLECTKEAYDEALSGLVWTIKQGHVIAAHSDTHFYDPSAGLCNYVKMNAITKIEPKYAQCGKDPAADMVRGALRLDSALNNETTGKPMRNVRRGRKPSRRCGCTLVCLAPTQLGAEKDARAKTGDLLYAGKLPCRNETKPWNIIGWDTEWRLDAKALNDTQKEKCGVVKDITDQFDRKDKVGPKPNNVVLLTHDYFFSDMAKATIFRDVIVELQQLGYTLGTIDQYPI